MLGVVVGLAEKNHRALRQPGQQLVGCDRLASHGIDPRPNRSAIALVPIAVRVRAGRRCQDRCGQCRGSRHPEYQTHSHSVDRRVSLEHVRAVHPGHSPPHPWFAGIPLPMSREAAASTGVQLASLSRSSSVLPILCPAIPTTISRIPDSADLAQLRATKPRCGCPYPAMQLRSATLFGLHQLAFLATGRVERARHGLLDHFLRLYFQMSEYMSFLRIKPTAPRSPDSAGYASLTPAPRSASISRLTASGERV
jgi:hypothetical protein